MRQKIAVVAVFVMAALGTGWLISGAALGAEPVTNNITVGCDEATDNLVYVLKQAAVNVVPDACPLGGSTLQKNVTSRCNQGNLLYVLRSRFGPIDMETVPADASCPQPV